MLGLDRAIRPKHCPVLGSDTKIDDTNIHAASTEDFYYLGLKDDAATSTIEIVGGALENVDLPADLTQQGSCKKPAQRPANDESPVFM